MQNVMNRETKEKLLDQWEQLTGYDATQDTFFDWNDEEWWKQFAAAVEAKEKVTIK